MEWTAGYDGEVQQQFYIQYQSSNAQDWNTVEVADRKSDTRLSFDIYNLQPSTEYMLRVFSANAVGNSSLSDTLTFRMRGKTFLTCILVCNCNVTESYQDIV